MSTYQLAPLPHCLCLGEAGFAGSCLLALALLALLAFCIPSEPVLDRDLGNTKEHWESAICDLQHSSPALETDNRPTTHRRDFLSLSSSQSGEGVFFCHLGLFFFFSCVGECFVCKINSFFPLFL